MKIALFVLMAFLQPLVSNASPTYGASEIFARNRQAVVHITVSADSNTPNSKPNLGTGFIISTDGYVVTAKHVISTFVTADRTPIKVTIGSLFGVPIPADIIAQDGGQDIALLKLVSATSVGLTGYRPVLRGDQKSLKMGDPVFLLGFNFTSNMSVEPGTLSATMGGGVCGATCWEVSAPGAVFGMSGAPVFSSDGTVIGMVVGGRENTSVLFILPEQLLTSMAITADWKRSAHIDTLASGNASVMDGNLDYGRSGFSFSRQELVPWNSRDADILVANPNKPPSTALFFLPFDAPPYASPDDVGAESGIVSLPSGIDPSGTECPSTGYRYHYFTPKVDSSYCVRTRSGKGFVFVTVKGVYADRIVFDYQVVK